MSSKINLNNLLNKPISSSEIFHQKTKIKQFDESLDNKLADKIWEKKLYKGYSRLPEIILPKPELPSDISFLDVLRNRKSERECLHLKLPISKLSSLLYYSAGLKKNKKGDPVTRFYPSAGARYPLELYILSLNIEQLSRGLYHYYIKNHSLEKLLAIDVFNLNDYFNQKFITRTSCIIILTSIFKRTTIKYGNRGYRHILIEAGHLGQNIYLLASALEFACCSIGGFIDDRLNQLLDIEGVTESILYVFALGRKKY